MEIHFTTQIFEEGRMFVAHTPELDVSSCGETKDRAARNLKEAVRLFLEESAKMGTLDQIPSAERSRGLHSSQRCR